MLSLLLAVTLTANAPAAAGVLAAESQLNDAVAKRDVATVRSLLTEDYSLGTSSGRFLKRSALLKNVADTSFAYTKNRAHDQTVRFFGDNVAIVTGILEQEGTMNGKAVSIPVTYTDTWIRVDGRWIEAAGQASRLAGRR